MTTGQQIDLRLACGQRPARRPVPFCLRTATAFRWSAWLFLALCPLAVTTLVPAEEPAQRFLEALRERGHYDLAMVYLDQMESSPLAPGSFRRRIPMLRAETIVESVGKMRNLEQSESRLIEAQRLLEEFSATASTIEDRCFASESLAGLRFRQARVWVNRSESATLPEAEREQARLRARELLADCIKAYQTARQITRERLEVLLKPGSDPAAIDAETLDSLKKSYTQIQLRLPIATEFLADTHAPGSPERIQLLGDAEKNYLQVWEKYSRYAAGVDACLFAARCRQKLGRHAEALQLLDELLALEAKPALLPIQLRAALLAIESWNAVQPYPHEAVIQRLQPIVNILGRRQAREPDWLKVQLEIARGLRAKAESLAANNGRPAEVRDLNQSAAALARTVARVPGPEQKRALDLLAAWKIEVNVTADSPDTDAPPQDFAEARSRAVELVADLDSQRVALQALRARLKEAAPDERAAIEQELETATAALKKSADAAIDLLRQALALANADTRRSDLNQIRYLQAFCHHAAGRHLQAALIGEFLLDHWPAEEWTRQAVSLAMNSWALLYDAAGDDRRFERDRMTSLCNRVRERWPGSPEASQAAANLARVALAGNDVSSVEALLGDMSPESASRAALSLPLAQKIWNEVQAARAGLTDDQLRARLPEFTEQLQKARVLVEEGLAAARAESVDFTVARSSLLLARILLEQGEPRSAVDQLERAGIGPLDLIKQGHPAVTGSPAADALRREALRTAITAYLGCMKSGGDAAQWVGRAEGVVNALREELRGLPADDSRRELNAVYAATARELRGQIASLSTAPERLAMAQQLAVFLRSTADTATDGRTVLWAATTMIEVAGSVADSGTGTSPAAVPLYRSAIGLLERAKAAGFAGDAQAEALELETGRYLGLARRGTGEWDQAIEAFAEILGRRPSLLKAQLDAAETLQLQGLANRDPAALGLAMMGTRPVADPKTRRKANSIWGWRQLVLATRDKEEFREVHLRSLLGLIECRLEYGRLLGKAEAIQSARDELANFRQRDPELGGPNWKERFEELGRRMEQPTGAPPR